jgi:hypothetical protein
VALCVRDDKFAAILRLSIKSLLGHDQASAFRGFFPYFIQIIKLMPSSSRISCALSLMWKK